MTDVQFLSDEWLAALDRAARQRPVDDDDPLASVSVSIEQRIRNGPRWRFVVDRGALSVRTEADGLDGDADVRLTSDRETATEIASGQRPALDAFIAGDLVLGGDVRALLDNRVALEAVGDLFADVRADTEFS